MLAQTIPLMGANTLTPYVDEYLRGRVARRELTQRTAVKIRYSLIVFDESFGRRPITHLTARAVDRWLDSISELEASTRRCYLSRVRKFCRWLLDKGVIDGDPTSHVPPITQPRHVVVTLGRAQVGALMRACPDVRAQAMVAMLVWCGCRCVELERLRVEDYDADQRIVLLRGKGWHEREVPVPVEAAEAIGAWLDQRKRTTGHMFPGRGGPIKASTIGGYVRRWMLAAGVKAGNLDGRSAHALRRTAGSDVMDECGDIRIVQAMLGHARVETTAKYYLRAVPIARLREAMEGRDYRAA